MAGVTCLANAAVLSSTASSWLSSSTRLPSFAALPVRRSTRGAPICAKLYTVAPGDTLWKISQKEGVKLSELKMENGEVINPDYLVPGQTIKISGYSTTTRQATNHVLPEQKTVGTTIAFVLLGAAVFLFFKGRGEEDEPGV